MPLSSSPHLQSSNAAPVSLTPSFGSRTIYLSILPEPMIGSGRLIFPSNSSASCL